MNFAELLSPSKPPHDCVRLDLPWGCARTFAVPARDSSNPAFQFLSRLEAKARDASHTIEAATFSRGIHVSRVYFEPVEFSGVRVETVLPNEFFALAPEE